MVEPYSSNFRVITTNILGVRIFRKFTVFSKHSMNFVTELGLHRAKNWLTLASKEGMDYAVKIFCLCILAGKVGVG